MPIKIFLVFQMKPLPNSVCCQSHLPPPEWTHFWKVTEQMKSVFDNSCSNFQLDFPLIHHRNHDDTKLNQVHLLFETFSSSYALLNCLSNLLWNSVYVEKQKIFCLLIVRHLIHWYNLRNRKDDHDDHK